MATQEEQQAIEQFLGDQPTSDQIRIWRDTLVTRRRRLQRDVASADAKQAAALRSRLADLDRQIAVLNEESLVTEFVEDSVRATLAMGSVAEGMRAEE